MCSPFTCGGFNNHEDDDLELLSPCKYSALKVSKRNTSFGSRSKDSKNPYANRGLEKFYELLADLDEKRQKIYTQIGFEDVSLVRFVYSNSNHVKPIVVKVKEKRSQDHKANIRLTTNNHEVSEKSTVDMSKDVTTTNEVQQVKEEKSDRKNMTCCLICGRFKLEKFRQPYYYFPVVIMIVLMLLAIYGRSFAILCTSIGWYVIPTIKGGSSDLSKLPKGKKEYVKKVSEKKIVTSEGLSSPRSVLNGPKDKSPRQHG
ncbi:ZCF37 [Forsythia ovata]|uniref:ZCF37 n=1 Tax=Forsythia ovata TaxID=205694 RepID=A0ABD1U779_9LAMI